MIATAEQEPEAEDEDKPARDEAENRVVVKFFWNQLGRPPKDEWKNRHGVISLIRRRMGAGAPTVRTVERTLERLVEDEHSKGADSDGCMEERPAGAHPAP